MTLTNLEVFLLGRGFYEKCVAIETDNYKLYINDRIFKLSERSKQDCFTFVKGKLEKIKQNIYIYHWVL